MGFMRTVWIYQMLAAQVRKDAEDWIRKNHGDKIA
jgi:hypothetical protein